LTAMVNSAVGEILAALRASGDYVSGEALGNELGVSRVSIWKYIRNLKQHGYVIETSSRGYYLVSSPDLLLPWEVTGWEQKVRHYGEVNSTMEVAKELAKKGVEEGTIVVAESQSRGRGRLGREWSSPVGGIYCTVVLRPKVSPAYAPRISLMASVAVARTIRDLFGLPAELKWPNDVLIGGKKVCGILAEMEAETDELKFVNLGIGMNVNCSISQERATSLRDELGRDVSRKMVLGAVLAEIQRQQNVLTTDDLLAEWKKLSVTLGREVRVASLGEEISGKAIDVDSDGALIVACPDGSVKKVFAGDCLHV
jgi:BirA family biotin operon repressor/biotin-[acetyl-CoA-carboxylase] ligase